jgi:hypothetical protein
MTLSKPKDDGMFVFEFLNSEYAIHVINVCSDDGLRWGGCGGQKQPYTSIFLRKEGSGMGGGGVGGGVLKVYLRVVTLISLQILKNI